MSISTISSSSLMVTSLRSSHSSSTARGRTSFVIELDQGSNDGASPSAVRGSGSGSPFASVNSGAASQRAMIALVRDSVAGASWTGDRRRAAAPPPCGGFR